MTVSKISCSLDRAETQAFNARAFLVGLSLLSFIGPFIPENLAANEILRGLVPFFTGASN